MVQTLFIRRGGPADHRPINGTKPPGHVFGSPTRYWARHVEQAAAWLCLLGPFRIGSWSWKGLSTRSTGIRTRFAGGYFSTKAPEFAGGNFLPEYRRRIPAAHPSQRPAPSNPSPCPTARCIKGGKAAGSSPGAGEAG